MSDFIMSEDYKKFLKKQGIELSDWEKATLFIITGNYYMMT